VNFLKNFIVGKHENLLESLGGLKKK
jgi:hypothetical protein